MADESQIARLIQEAKAGIKPPMDLQTFCFGAQLSFVMDKARFKAACCSRRAGKTMGIAAYLLATALAFAGTASLYLTLTRLQAKRIIWEPLKEINETYGLGADPHETELTLRFPNGSVIYLSGAKDREEVKKYLGFPLKLVAIDEAQSFRAYIKELIDDTLAPAMFDYAGTIAVIGTPGPVPTGYFYDLTKNEAWSRFAWTMLDNPHLKRKSGIDPMALILEECKRRGISIDHPSIQRHCFGRWVNDSEARVILWSEKNDYGALPGGLWSHVLGVDIGYDDADAIAALGWSDKASGVYLKKETIKTKQGITELAGAIREGIEEFSPIAVIMDTGGLGKKIAAELINRFHLPITAAHKADKSAGYELLNDALRTERFFAKKESQFAHDSMLLEKDRDKSNGDKLVVSDAFHSDICDAVLYPFRWALDYLKIAPGPPAPKEGSAAWALEEAKRLEEAAELAYLEEMREKSDPYGMGEGWAS